MKKFTLLLLCLTILQMANAQTTLQPSDVAIVQVNYTFNSFDFVCFVDIEAGTKIWFTDFAYSNTLGNLDETSTSDGKYLFTAAQAIPAGTVVQYRNPSNVNPQFMNYGSSVNFRSFKNSYNLFGENLIVYQESNNVKTYLFAMGWMRKDNFSANPNNSLAKVCDIPTGLSKSNYTVIQIDSVMKAGQNPQLARDFRYNKYEGFTGTAFMLRRNLVDVTNYNTFSGTFNNDPVENFVVLAPDNTAPVLTSSYPTDNKINVSVNSGVELIFNEKIEALKPILIRNTSTQATIIVTKDEIAVTDSILSFSFDQRLDYASNYVVEIPQAAISDLNGNIWPTNDSTIHFVTSAKRSNISIDFSAAKENLKWTTQSTVEDFEGYYLLGFWSFSINNLPMRWYINEHGETETSVPSLPCFGNDMFIGGMNNSRLVIDLSAINNTITNIDSYVYDNNCQIVTSVYSNGNIIKSKKVTNSNNSPFTIYENHYVKQYIANDNAVKIDSVVFSSLEGRVFKTNFELIDLAAPTVELGNARVLCEGDSVQLDAGYTPGAVYDWNTGAKTQKIWAKTSDTYSVTVKNTLGQVSDNVIVTVRPTITVSLPDTIYACVSDTVTLTAGTDVSNSYLWSPNAETTPSIKVTKSGSYHVVVNNGTGGCFSTDSTRVIFNGAKVRFFNYQGGSYGLNDVRAKLYRKNIENKFIEFRDSSMLDFVEFDALPIGDYIMKMHFVNYSFVGENPWLDTYHDGKTEWKKVVPFHLTCETDTMIGFLIANKPIFEFNGTGVISGKIQIVGGGASSVSAMKVKATTNMDCDTRIVLYNNTGEIIATTCPDSNGNYSFTNLPAGNYTVGIERTGFEVESVFTTTVANGVTISNADFTIDENEQVVLQGLTTKIYDLKNQTYLTLNIYPNPLRNSGYIEVNSANACKGKITISDLTGRVMNMLDVQVEIGMNKYNLCANGLQGLYLLSFNSKDGTVVKRIFIK